MERATTLYAVRLMIRGWFWHGRPVAMRSWGEQAAKTLLDLKLRQLESETEPLDQETKQELLSDIRRRYFDQLDVRYAAARLWVDRIVQPNRTREALKMVLDVVRCNPDIPEFKTGVLQV